MVAPQPPVWRSTKFGTLPAAILRPSASPLIAAPLRNCACVHTDATVVISLMTTLGGGVLPSTASSAAAGLSPAPLFTAASPPLATRYRMTSVPRVSWLPNSNRPSLLVLACASCRGSPALALQRVTVEFASGPPPAWTCPSIRTPDRCCANPVLAAVTAPNATSAPKQIVLAMLMVSLLTMHHDEGANSLAPVRTVR